MTQEEKQLLIKDLCARLPYGVKCDINGEQCEVVCINPDRMWVYLRKENGYGGTYSIARGDFPKPYLRLMSSMTEEEMSELRQWGSLCMTPDDCVEDVGVYGAIHSIPVIDWLNAHHFDYRGMIEKGLALPAKEGMY